MSAEIVHGEPDWRALELTIPRSWWGTFMWMGQTRGGIQLYKHGDTRRYLNLRLAPNGAVYAYRYDGWLDDYVPISVAQALRETRVAEWEVFTS